jgi:hypothetical protein
MAFPVCFPQHAHTTSNVPLAGCRATMLVFSSSTRDAHYAAIASAHPTILKCLGMAAFRCNNIESSCHDLWHAHRTQRRDLRPEVTESLSCHVQGPRLCIRERNCCRYVLRHQRPVHRCECNARADDIEFISTWRLQCVNAYVTNNLVDVLPIHGPRSDTGAVRSISFGMTLS